MLPFCLTFSRQWRIVSETERALADLRQHAARGAAAAATEALDCAIPASCLQWKCKERSHRLQFRIQNVLYAKTCICFVGAARRFPICSNATGGRKKRAASGRTEIAKNISNDFNSLLVLFTCSGGRLLAIEI